LGSAAAPSREEDYGHHRIARGIHVGRIHVRQPTATPAFPHWAGPAARLRHLLGYAVRAPSRHNSQPWLFEIEGDELRVLADRRRALRVADPQGREMLMACGAAIENLRLGACHHGHDVALEPLAGGREADLVARLRLGERRIPDREEEQLYAAIDERRSALVLRSTDVEGEVMDALLRESLAEGCTLRRIRPPQARPVVEIVAQAEVTQWSNARFRNELAMWTSGDARRRHQPEAPRTHSTTGRLLRLLSRLRAGARELDQRIAAHTRSMLVLATPGDEPRDWLAAGRAMQRVLLRCTAEGLLASLLSPVIEVPDARQRLRRALFEPGHPQLLLRVGYGTTPRANPRRPVELVLRNFAEPAEVEVPVVDVDAA